VTLAFCAVFLWQLKPPHSVGAVVVVVVGIVSVVVCAVAVAMVWKPTTPRVEEIATVTY
jgi:hypothetical protein